MIARSSSLNSVPTDFSTQFLLVGDILRHCKNGIDIFRDTNLTKRKIDNTGLSWKSMHDDISVL